MAYLTVAEAAARLGLSVRRVRLLAEQGRLPGAKKFGGWTWQIPEAALTKRRQGRVGQPRKRKEQL